MRGERVRGGLPDPGFYALPGLEQAQAIQRGLVPRPPLAHLTGLTVTQVGPGTAVLRIPASPWLDHGSGLLDVHVLAEAALSMAVLTGAPPAMDVRTAVLSVTHFRPATLDANTLITHARTVRSAAMFTFAEGAVEDDLGREVASFTGAVVVRPREPPPPATVPLGTAFEEPAYPTPDPYQRPLPAGVGPLPRQHWEQYDGFTLVSRLVTGEYCPPLYALLGLRVLEVEHGRAVVALAADESLSYRGHEIAPGGLAALTYQALIIASLTLSPVGGRLGAVNLSARFLGPVVPDGRELVADAETLSDHDGDSVVASVTVTDADGKRVATAYQTSVLLPLRARPPARSEPVLVTVVFTDLVGSTALAGRLGDEQWRHLLAEQEAVVRQQLEAQRGREIKTTGDGFLATFDSPARAVRCARAIRDRTQRLGMDVRAGVHTGECEFVGGDITGIAVHLAARVLDKAAPGDVLVSSTVRDLLLGSGLCFEDRGHHILKGIDGEWQLFALEE